MEGSVTAETQLIADVAALRERFPNTQELYREVCTVMFFRYGITPTANKLYQYVKKGSMSAPTEALGKFWDTLRKKSRVRIEHPDLPEDLKTRAGDMAAALWDLAQQGAHASLNAYQDEARAKVLEAQSARTQAEAEREALRKDRESSQADLAQAREQIGKLQQQLAAAAAARDGLNAQLSQAQSDITACRHANERSRHDFAAEIATLRQESQLAEERSRAAEKRALLEIDRERSAAAKLQKELEVAHGQITRIAEQHRLEVLALQQQLGDMRQRGGQLEGHLEGAKGHGEQLVRDLQDVQRLAFDEASRAAALESERNSWRTRAEEAEKGLREFKEQARKQRPAKR
jgi:chromosome segregation ATPase